jgi:hypothetical protein
MKPIPRSREDRKRLDADDEIDRFLLSESGRTRVRGYFEDLSSQDSMVSLLKSTLELPGDVIECGVFRGMSLRRIGLVLSETAPDKSLYGLDSFEGFPSERVSKVDQAFLRFLPLLRRKFKMCNDTPDRLQRFFDCYGIRGQTVRGFFSQTLSQFSSHQFCFVHLDCDIYESYKECLDFLYPRLIPGGVIVFDDYRSPKWPGAEKAVDEFFADRPETVELCSDRQHSSWYIRKTPAKFARMTA